MTEIMIKASDYETDMNASRGMILDWKIRAEKAEERLERSRANTELALSRIADLLDKDSAFYQRTINASKSEVFKREMRVKFLARAVGAKLLRDLASGNDIEALAASLAEVLDPGVVTRVVMGE